MSNIADNFNCKQSGFFITFYNKVPATIRNNMELLSSFNWHKKYPSQDHHMEEQRHFKQVRKQH